MKWVRLRGMSAVAGLAAAGLLAAGCGAPHYTYVANTDTQTYFKVPHSWQQISTSALVKAITGGSSSASSAWTVGFDASAAPNAQHVLGEVPPGPFVYATVGQLSKTTSDMLSYNVLRDFFLPVTDSARQNAAAQGFPLTGFKLLSSSEVTPSGGIHGVRETYNYTYPGGRVVTFDQLALTDADDTRVYLLLVHCTAACYSQNKAQISTVMNSFTVRSSG